MPECYDVAAVRHFRDGDVLSEQRCLANADQLYGFAAECAIKSALVTLPTYAQGGDLEGKYREHVDVLWGRVLLQSLHRRYRTLALVIQHPPQPFADWSVRQRYGPDDVVSEPALDRHRQAARRILGSVGLAGTRRKE